MQDDAADELAEPWRSQKQDAPGTPILLGRFHANCLEPLGDRWAAFVGGKNALALPHQRFHRCLQFASSAHDKLLQRDVAVELDF